MKFLAPKKVCQNGSPTAKMAGWDWPPGSLAEGGSLAWTSRKCLIPRAFSRREAWKRRGRLGLEIPGRQAGNTPPVASLTYKESRQ